MAYVVSLIVGVGVGVAYALIGVRSPAPPLVALFGLLGIVIGEQGLPWVRARLAQQPAAERSIAASVQDGKPSTPVPEETSLDHALHVEDPERAQAGHHAGGGRPSL